MFRTKAKTVLFATAFACASIVGPAANAATTTATFGVSITILKACAITSASAMAFGSNSNSLTTNTDTTSAISVLCTATTPYNIGLDQGTTSGSTVASRKMVSGASTVNYALYSDAARTSNWGNTVGTDTVAGTGTGLPVATTVYGRVPVQTAPAAGAYTDTVTVTVTY